MREMFEIDTFCGTRFADHFYQVTGDREARRFTVHRVPSPELDEAVRGQFADRDVEFADAPHSSAQLATVRQTVRDLEPGWSARGVVFNGVTTDEGGSAVVVHVAGDEAVLTEFEAELRPLPVRLLRNGVVLL